MISLTHDFSNDMSGRIRALFSSSNTVSSNSLGEKHRVSALLKESISCDQLACFI